MKPRRIREAVHVTCMGRMNDEYKIWSENMKEREHLQEVGLDGRIISEWILKKQDEMVWSGFIRLRIGTSGGLL
jgi:hypothetical protein